MIYFITENYLKNNTPITANVDVTDVVPYIRTQSDMRLKPILGSFFYSYLLLAYNTQALNPDEEALVELIQPVIAWRSAEDCAIGLSYQLKNKGIQIQSGDFSNSASMREVTFISDHYGQKAQFFERRLIAYLKENKDLFPEFVSKQNKDTDIKPTSNGSNDFNDSIIII